jgi:hypothetical protein
MKNMSDNDGCLWAVLAVILLIALMFISPWIEMMLWNWVMVDLFAMPTVTFWQMFGLNWLCGLLFRRSSNISTSKNK